MERVTTLMRSGIEAPEVLQRTTLRMALDFLLDLGVGGEGGGGEGR